MAPTDRRPGAEPGIGLRDLLGLHGLRGWLFLFVLQLTIVVYLLPDLTRDAALPVFAGLGLILGAGALALVVPTDPLPLPIAALVGVAAVGSAALTASDLHSTRTHHVMWGVFASAYVLAVLVIRDRMITALLAAAALLALIIGAGVEFEVRPDEVLAAASPITVVVAVAGFGIVMRPTQQSLRRLREEATVRAAAQASLTAAEGERTRQLARLDRAARPILEWIAAGVDPTAAQREECRLLEAELRDGLRAPWLATPALAAAARGARGRGVEVVLLDDGGFGQVPSWVRDSVIGTAVAELDAAATGSITVRVLPPGRRLLATILADSGGTDRRIEIDTSGRCTEVE
ncbi:hypothetical protein [Nocardia stercoris]|uniref:Uncharacterized protein n=1 Tax=Nocardia stercoris TaxID=2483361 RepID=A0A3M2KQL7_9NOCA|nr:hypothetical protein [Nocardia stercoris]RMI27937.1 hypothetical protein EBN03_32410 [Nocardia stercoris]